MAPTYDRRLSMMNTLANVDYLNMAIVRIKLKLEMKITRSLLLVEIGIKYHTTL